MNVPVRGAEESSPRSSVPMSLACNTIVNPAGHPYTHAQAESTISRWLRKAPIVHGRYHSVGRR